MKSEREIKERVEEYMKLNYKIEITQSDEGGYFAEIPDLPGCMTAAENFNEINGMIEDAKESWLEERLHKGLPIPAPSKDEEFSGKTMVRMPRSLHRKLSQQAKNENVSLNQYIVHLLSTGTSSRNNINLAQASIKNEVDKLVEFYMTRASTINTEPLLLRFNPAQGHSNWIRSCSPFENILSRHCIASIDVDAFIEREEQPKPRITQLIASKKTAISV